MREEYWHIIAALGSVSLLTIIQTGRAEPQSCPAQPQHCSDLEGGKLGEGGDGGDGGDGVGVVGVVPLGDGQTDLTTH